MSTTTRDVTRSRAYEAESRLCEFLARQHDCPTVSIAGSIIALPTERRFGDLEGVQRYVDSVMALNWVQAEFPQAGPISVRERAGDRFAHYQGGVIAVPLRGTRWAMREVVVLHELAHGLNPLMGPSHGKSFQHTFCELLSGCLAPEAGFLMQVLLAQHGA